MSRSPLGLFAGFGIELEYMVVHRETLKPLAIVAEVLQSLAGEPTMTLERGEVAWSNELALHVLELKGNGPKSDLRKLHQCMMQEIRTMNRALSQWQAMLLPSAMHPFLDPRSPEIKLWTSEDAEIYESYNRIFGCNGHGWVNLQSIHINLPFSSDEEFGLLHQAVRLILPLLPALAASSPYVESKRGPYLDSRLHYYLQNQRRIPSILGDGIPEDIRTKKDYEEVVLKPMYRDIAPLDPEGLLQHEWLNSRAAIARFDRNAIEIRILDIQECLLADFSIIHAVISGLRYLVDRLRGSPLEQSAVSQKSLVAILYGALTNGVNFEIPCNEYLNIWNAKGSKIHDIVMSWSESLDPRDYRESFRVLAQGHSLATRLVASCGNEPIHEGLVKAYKELSGCLETDTMYRV